MMMMEELLDNIGREQVVPTENYDMKIKKKKKY
jgi:hypothetical protein